VRKGRVDDARASLRRFCGAAESDEEIDQTIAMMYARRRRTSGNQADQLHSQYTNEVEKQYNAGTSYADCFKGANRRRTEITCIIWMTQNWCGNGLMSQSTYFYEQAGLKTAKAFDMSMVRLLLSLRIGTDSATGPVQSRCHRDDRQLVHHAPVRAPDALPERDGGHDRAHVRDRRARVRAPAAAHERVVDDRLAPHRVHLRVRLHRRPGVLHDRVRDVVDAPAREDDRALPEPVQHHRHRRERHQCVPPRVRVACADQCAQRRTCSTRPRGTGARRRASSGSA
jgi:hypothetical protein